MKRSLNSTRSRGGCARCKAKHVKCDEAKPECSTCRASGAECPGYGTQLRWSNKHEVLGEGSRRRRRRISSAVATPAGPDSSRHPPVSQEQVMTPSASVGEEHASLQVSLPLNYVFQDGTTNTGTEMDPLWPNLDGCSYEDLGLSDSLLLELGLQYSHQEPIMYGFQSEHGPNMGQLAPSAPSRTHAFSRDTLPMLRIQDKMVADTTRDQHTNGSSQRDETTSPGSKNSLLQTYYRLSKPGQVIGLTDESFVDYYFENVCSIFSCFDSAANPFRSLAEQTWTNSAAMYLTIQSTAIGHLANYYPYLAPLGIEKRSQAWKYLQRDLQSFRIGKVSGDTLLMTLLLLGLSSSWHQASNLGMQYLLIARDLMQRRLQGVQNRADGSPDETGSHDGFFEHALMYWEMLASFVDPVPLAPLAGQIRLPDPDRPSASSPAYAHPWTGVVPEVHFALAEIGRVLRRRRGCTPALRSPAAKSPSFAPSEGQWAKALECFLLAVEMPEDDEIHDYDDIKTPKADLTALADAYRFAGLLEIYGLYPALLEARLSSDASMFEALSPTAISMQPAYSDILLVWRVTIANHILNLTKPIPVVSGSCRLMPLLLGIAASQLRFPDASSTPDDTMAAQHSEIITTRCLIEARMLVLSRKYPQRPLIQMLDIIKEVWQRLDNGDEGAHWLEVMHEMGWQTIMG